MRITDRSRFHLMDCAVQAVPENGEVPAGVAAEHWMDVWINERLAMRIVCTPEHLDELVVGRLLTEGLVQRPEDIREIYLCEQGLRAKVLLREGSGGWLDAADAPAVSSCCTDNRTLLRSRLETAPVDPIPWDPAWLLQAAGRMREEAPLYSETHAVHACYLVREDRILCCREDIGRHNALDKAVGWGCLQGIDLTRCLLFTTGRMPSDMVSKAVRARVPVLASKTYPSDLGIQLAIQARLTLATVRPGGELLVWNDGTRQKGE